MRKPLFALALLVLPLTLLADDVKGVRELKVEGLPGGQGRVEKPTVITSTDELAKVFEKNEAVQTAIKKEVQFDKEKVVFFSWGGSGQDRIIPKEGKEKGAVVFQYQPGATDDFRRHARVFAIPKEASFKVAPVRGE